MSYPDGNPKTLLGAAKVPLGLVSPVAMAHEAKALALGEKKYGPANWRKDAVSSSVYFHAALRHLYQWWEGQDIDPESEAHHLGHARACLGILLDAASVNKLNDNRPSKGNLEEVLEALRVKPEETPSKTSSYRYVGSKAQMRGLVFKLRNSPDGGAQRMVHRGLSSSYSIVVRQGSSSAWVAVAGHGYFYPVGEA